MLSVSGHAPMATRGDGTGPGRLLGARTIYWDPVEAPRRKHLLLRVRHRLVGRRGAVSELMFTLSKLVPVLLP